MQNTRPDGKLIDSIVDAFDTRTDSSATQMFDDFSKIESNKQKAEVAHAIRYGALFSFINFATNVLIVKFPFLPASLIKYGTGKVQHLIVLRLDKYDTFKKAERLDAPKGNNFFQAK